MDEREFVEHLEEFDRRWHFYNAIGLGALVVFGLIVWMLRLI
jgi:hypothetical protein